MSKALAADEFGKVLDRRAIGRAVMKLQGVSVWTKGPRTVNKTWCLDPIRKSDPDARRTPFAAPMGSPYIDDPVLADNIDENYSPSDYVRDSKGRISSRDAQYIADLSNADRGRLITEVLNSAAVVVSPGGGSFPSPGSLRDRAPPQAVDVTRIAKRARLKGMYDADDERQAADTVVRLAKRVGALRAAGRKVPATLIQELTAARRELAAARV